MNLFVVNKPWLFSLLWCAGVNSVTTNDCQLLQQMHYPVWLIVRTLGLAPLLFSSHPWFSLTLCLSSLFIPHPRPTPIYYLWDSGHQQGPFLIPTAPSNLPNDVDHYQLCLYPAAFVDLPPPTVSALCSSFLGLYSSQGPADGANSDSYMLPGTQGLVCLVPLRFLDPSLYTKLA